MRLSTLAILAIVASLLSFPSTGCGWWNDSANPAGQQIEPPPSDVPFPTKEPERFRAIVTTRAAGIERKVAFARDGTNTRIDFQPGSEMQLTAIDGRENIIISERHRIYAVLESSSGVATDEFVNDLTERLLHKRTYADYESLGTENGLERYRVQVQGAEAQEILIYVDKGLGMPVIQEFYSVAGETRELQYRMTVSEVSLDVDAALFEPPKEFKKVTVDEFYRTIRKDDGTN